LNFENYNNIYKEILDDEIGDLSANYLLNKYEIKHDEELLNILNQIKKNEYISSDNKVISKLISELDENDNSLDINEIINIKDKVIDTENLNFQYENYEENQNIETNAIIKDKSEKSQEIINKTKSNKSYILFSLIILIIIISIFFFLNSGEEEKVIPISEVENTKIIEENKIEENKTKIEESNLAIDAKNEEIVLPTSENIIKEEIPTSTPISPSVIKTEEINSNSEDTLDKIETSLEEKQKNKIETPQLKSLNEISNYVNEFQVKDNKLFFEGNSYSENDNLFGFKIFKITPYYIKFEDINKNIRKRYLIK